MAKRWPMVLQSLAGVGRQATSMLTQPMLKSFLVGHLRTSQDELERGAAIAHDAVSDLLLSRDRFQTLHRPSTNALPSELLEQPSLADESAATDRRKRDRLERMVEASLLQELTSCASMLPVSAQCEVASLVAVNLVLGVTRQAFARDPSPYVARVSVGDHLEVVGRTDDIDVDAHGTRAGSFLSSGSWQLYRETVQRRIIATRGLTAQLVMEMDVNEVHDAGGGLLAEAARRTWVFETPLEGLGDPPSAEWVVVDVEGVMNGNKFWSAVPKDYSNVQ